MSIPALIRERREIGRAAATTLLRLAGRSNGRWRRDQSLDAAWDERAKQMVADIPAGSRVIDIGAGSQAVRGLLPAGCDYVPVDLVSRSPDTVVCDLNRDALPELTADWLIASGVLEYVFDVDRVVAWMASAAPRIALSYETADDQTRYYRRARSWVNDYTGEQMHALLAGHGLEVARTAKWKLQTIYWLQRAQEADRCQR
jgi:methyltransferase family protein